MMHRWIAAVGIIAVVGLACAARAQTTCPTPSSTLDLLQRGIFEQHGCTRSYCHGDGKQDGLDLRAGIAYDSLLHHTEADADAANEADPLVIPGKPEQSVLWQTLAVKTIALRGTDVTGMPLDGLAVSRDELEGVRLWILAGAPEVGFVAGVDGLIQACPASTDDGGPLPDCQPGETDLLLPDLTTEVPRDVQLLYRDGHRQLQFSTAIDNNGDGPLIVQAATAATQPGQTLEAMQVIVRQDGSKCVHPAGSMTFTDDGMHWAYGHTVDFELRKDDPYTGPVVARASKTAFCLLDTDAISTRETRPHQFEAHCTDTIGRMGISVGYKDVYHRIHPGQWIDLDSDPNAPVPTGSYYLVNVANPLSTILETDSSRDENLNFKAVSVNLQPLSGGSVQPTPVPPAPEPTPPANVRQPHQPHQPQSPSTSRPAHTVNQPKPPHQPGSPSTSRPRHSPQVGRNPQVPERPVPVHALQQ